MRIGLLGAARITPPALVMPAADIAGARVHAVAARNPDSARRFARAHAIGIVHDDYAALVSDPQIDLVYNPLPVHLHARWSIEALRAGKHVLCEKPFAMNADEAREVLRVAAECGRRVVEAFHYRYHPMFTTLLSWLATGRIGDIVHVRATFNAGVRDEPGEIRRRADTGGGAMMDLGCYPLNWALNVIDRPLTGIEARASVTDAGVDEAMVADLRFEGGATAHLGTSMHVDSDFFADLHIEGSAGEIHFDNPLAPHNGGRLSLTAADTELRADHDTRTTYYFQLHAVLEALAAGTPLPTEGDAILRQQDALDAVYAAAGLGHLRRV